MRDQDVRRLDVAMNDPLLMRVLDGLADRHEQFEPLARSGDCSVAVFGDRDAVDQFHHEVRPPAVGRSRVEHLGDVRVIHERQRLTLGFEPAKTWVESMPGLMTLSATRRLHRLGLLGDEDRAHAPFAEHLQQPITGDSVPIASFGLT